VLKGGWVLGVNYPPPLSISVGGGSMSHGQ